MSVRSGMADCAVALGALCLRIAPPESLDVTKLAHALVTLARPRRRVSGHGQHGSARSWGRAPLHGQGSVVSHGPAGGCGLAREGRRSGAELAGRTPASS